MIEAEWWEYDDAGEMADAVAGDIGFLIEQALDARGNAIVAFPADADAFAALDRLATAKLRWKNITIIPTDERLVPLTDKLSNVRVLAERFLPLGARVMPLSGGRILDPVAAARIANATLADHHWPLDLVWLGSGEDGHAAGLFAGPDLEAALESPERIVGITPAPLPADAPVPRLSLSRSAIAAARALTILVTGQKTRDVLEQALADGEESDAPVGRLLAGTAQSIDIHWCPKGD